MPRLTRIKLLELWHHEYNRMLAKYGDPVYAVKQADAAWSEPIALSSILRSKYV